MRTESGNFLRFPVSQQKGGIHPDPWAPVHPPEPDSRSCATPYGWKYVLIPEASLSGQLPHPVFSAIPWPLPTMPFCPSPEIHTVLPAVPFSDAYAKQPVYSFESRESFYLRSSLPFSLPFADTAARCHAILQGRIPATDSCCTSVHRLADRRLRQAPSTPD